MVAFKELLTELTVDFLTGYQERYNSISDAEVKQVLREGGGQARERADGVIKRVRDATGYNPDTFLN